MSEKVYKLGIIGAGAIVELSHLPAIKNIQQLEVNWIFDKNPERATLLSSMFQVPFIDELSLEDKLKEIDICLITIPYGARSYYIELCARHRKAVYIEKPFAITATEHQEICKLFPEYMLAVGFQKRSYPIVDTLRTIIDNKIFGSLKTIVFREGYFSLKGNKAYMSDARLSGGGVIIESAIHALDQILCITSAEKIYLKELKSLHKDGIDYESRFSSVLERNDGDVEIYCEITTLRNLKNGVELHFDHAILSCRFTPDSKIKLLGSDELGKTQIWNVSDEKSDKLAVSINHSFYVFWTDFLTAINTEKVNFTSGVSSLLTTRWIEQIYHQIRQTS